MDVNPQRDVHAEEQQRLNGTNNEDRLSTFANNNHE